MVLENSDHLISKYCRKHDPVDESESESESECESSQSSVKSPQCYDALSPIEILDSDEEENEVVAPRIPSPPIQDIFVVPDSDSD